VAPVRGDGRGPLRAVVAVVLALVLLVVGAAGGLATVLLHQERWFLVLGLAAALASTLALPRGWRRTAFMLGWAGAVAWATVPRAEGDYLIPGNGSGYLLLGGSLVVLLLALATSGPGRRAREDPGDPRPAT
jgi:hypothetical protein